MLLVSVLKARTIWRSSILRITTPILLGTMQLWLVSSVPVRLSWTKVTDVWGSVLRWIAESRFPSGPPLVLCEAVIRLMVQCTTVLDIRMCCVDPCRNLILRTATALDGSDPGLNTLALWCASTVSTSALLLVPGQATMVPTTNWLTRVLGRPNAFLLLTGPLAVTITNGPGSLTCLLLTAAVFLVTVLSTVDRAPVPEWPTLLSNMKPVRTGLTRAENCRAEKLNIRAFIRLDGTRLGAYRIWWNAFEIEAVSARVVAAPVRLGMDLTRTRLFVITAVTSVLCKLDRLISARVNSVWTWLASRCVCCRLLRVSVVEGVGMGACTGVVGTVFAAGTVPVSRDGTEGPEANKVTSFIPLR